MVTEVNPHRLQRAARLGFNAQEAGGSAALEAVGRLTAGEGADIVYECAGSPSASQAMTHARESRAARRTSRTPQRWRDEA